MSKEENISEKELLESINHRLGLVLKTLLLDDLLDKNRVEQVEQLEKQDFRDEDIQAVLGISSDNLNTIRHRMNDNE